MVKLLIKYTCFHLITDIYYYYIDLEDKDRVPTSTLLSECKYSV